MVKIELNIEQLEKAIGRLPARKKCELIEKLARKTWQIRFKQLLLRIDSRLKKHPISQKQINQIVEKAREEYHASRREPIGRSHR